MLCLPPPKLLQTLRWEGLPLIILDKIRESLEYSSFIETLSTPNQPASQSGLGAGQEKVSKNTGASSPPPGTSSNTWPGSRPRALDSRVQAPGDAMRSPPQPSHQEASALKKTGARHEDSTSSRPGVCDHSPLASPHSHLRDRLHSHDKSLWACSREPLRSPWDSASPREYRCSPQLVQPSPPQVGDH